MDKIQCVQTGVMHGTLQGGFKVVGIRKELWK